MKLLSLGSHIVRAWLGGVAVALAVVTVIGRPLGGGWPLLVCLAVAVLLAGAVGLVGAGRHQGRTSDAVSDTLHVIPCNDVVDHDTSTDGPDCVCGPDIERVGTDGGDGWIVVHHSLDGREVTA